jgi:hypothetical protein
MSETEKTQRDLYIAMVREQEAKKGHRPTGDTRIWLARCLEDGTTEKRLFNHMKEAYADPKVWFRSRQEAVADFEAKKLAAGQPAPKPGRPERETRA